MSNPQALITFIRSLYKKSSDFVALHEPMFQGNELSYVTDTINSTFVSSVGEYVNLFEKNIEKYTNCRKSVAVVNGTCGLQIGLTALGVKRDEHVITQAATFVGSANAIAHSGARPIFLDSDQNNLSLSPSALKNFLEEQCTQMEGEMIFKETGQRIAACMPVHIFGFAAYIDEIVSICHNYGIKVIEDAAEGFGTSYKDKHLGTFGDVGVFSFNGNKIITTGGGGCVVTNDEKLGAKIKHLTTTARVSHRWDYDHDDIGYNYRLPNLNAALGCAQLESLDDYIESKKDIYNSYSEFCELNRLELYRPCNFSDTRPNYWLNTLVTDNLDMRDRYLTELNDAGIMCRPLWRLMSDLKPFKNCWSGDLTNARVMRERMISLPSSPLPLRQS